MVAHLRTQIRDQMRDLIAIQIPGATVTSGHYHARNIDDSDLLIDIFAVNETVDLEQMSLGLRFHTTTFAVRAQRLADVGVDDLLDDDELLIRAALFSGDWSLLLIEDPEIAEVQFSRATNNEAVAVGALALRVTVTYRADKADPTSLEN